MYYVYHIVELTIRSGCSCSSFFIRKVSGCAWPMCEVVGLFTGVSRDDFLKLMQHSGIPQSER